MRLRNLLHRRDKSRSTVGIDINSFVLPAPAPDYTFSLPDDVIYEIFEAAALVYPPHSLARGAALAPTPSQLLHTGLGWIVLTHVTRRWRTIGLSASLSHLWARVVCMSWNVSTAEELSLRAHDRPITIDLSRYNGMSRSRRELWAIEDWADHHIERVSALISPGSALLDHLKKRKLVLPYLREVQFDSDMPWSYNPQWDVPRLRVAHLGPQLLPNAMGEMLRELYLDIDASQGPLSSLHGFLRRCPRLELLDVSLTGKFFRHTESSEEPISFAHLKRAKVRVTSDQHLLDLWYPIRSVPDLSFQLVYPGSEFWLKTLPQPAHLLDTCKREMGSVSYDSLEMGVSVGRLGEGAFRLCLSSSSTEASCDLSFPSDETTRRTFMSIIPSYISAVLSQITSLTFDGLAANTITIDLDTFGVLLRALTGVRVLELRNMDLWSVFAHVRVLRQAKLSPVLPSLRTLALSSIPIVPATFKVSDKPEVHRERTKQWWDAIGSALSVRKYECGVGGVKVLRLDGCWKGMRAWSESEDWWGMESIREKNLVTELVDRRVWEN